MKTHFRTGLALAAIAIAGLIAGCSSDGGGGSTPQAVSQGVITGFGSVFVNGIEFDTVGSSIVMDDQPSVQGSLGLGMVVTVRGSWDDNLGTGTASSVTYADDLQGPIGGIDAGLGTFTVLGQAVRVDQNTRYEHTTGLAGADPLAAGEIVEVSGLPDGSGAIRATHVERKGIGDDVELKGVVAGAPGADSFILVSASNPDLAYTVMFTGPLPSGIGSGSYVEVHVESFNAMTIVASEIELEDDLSPGEGAAVEIEGYVTSYVSPAQFEVNGIPVDASSVLNLPPLMNGLAVEVEGTNNAGVLVAHELSLKGTGEGVITAKGSIFVNGIEYDVAGATISVDGASATESSLSIGMVVQVRGRSDHATGTGQAEEIIYADDLQGPIETIDPVALTFVVLGMTVQTDNTTIFDDVAGFFALAVGDLVEVSGVSDPQNGTVRAAYVEKHAAGEMEIKGTVASWDGTSTFELIINDNAPIYVVDYSSMASSLPAEFADGVYVEVKASAFDAGTLTVSAEEIHIEDSLEPSDGEHVEVEGVISGYAASLQTFVVEGVSVNASALNPVGLIDGLEVEVEGPMIEGVLIATEITVEQESSIEVEGDVEAVDAALGTVTVLGTVFAVDVSTIMKDSSAAGLSALTLADLAAGDHLVVAAYPSDGTSYQAALVERKDAALQAMMQGPVTAYSDTAPFSVTILGNAIALAPGNPTQFTDLSLNPIDAASFFAAIMTPTTPVSVSWDDFVDFATAPNEAELESP